MVNFNLWSKPLGKKPKKNIQQKLPQPKHNNNLNHK